MIFFFFLIITAQVGTDPTLWRHFPVWARDFLCQDSAASLVSKLKLPRFSQLQRINLSRVCALPQTSEGRRVPGKLSPLTLPEFRSLVVLAGTLPLLHLELSHNALELLEPDLLTRVILNTREVGLKSELNLLHLLSHLTPQSPLQGLDLMGSDLTSLPPSLLATSLTRLKKLDLSSVRLTLTQTAALFQAMAEPSSRLETLELGIGLLTNRFEEIFLAEDIDPQLIVRGLMNVTDLSYNLYAIEEYNAAQEDPLDPVFKLLLEQMALGGGRLQRADIDENNFHHVDAKTVAAALTQLTELELRPNPRMPMSSHLLEVLKCLASPQSRVRRLRVELASLAWANPGLVARAVVNVEEVHLDCFLPSSHLQALYTALVAGASLRSLHLGGKNDMRRLPLGHLRRMLNLLNCKDVCSVLRRWEGAVILVQAQGPLVQGREVDGRDKGQWDEFFRVRRKRLIV